MTTKHIFILVVAAALLPFRLCAQTSLNVGNLPGYPGATVAVPVALRQAANVTAAQFDVAYNAARVTAGEFVPGAALANHVVRTREVAPGVRRVLIYSLANALMPTNGFNATLPISLPPTERVGSGPLTPGNVVVAHPDATAVVSVVLKAGEVFITPARRNADGTANFFTASEPGTNYVAQASTNLVQWTNIGTNVATDVWLDWLDVDAVNYPYRFYRALPEP